MNEHATITRASEPAKTEDLVIGRLIVTEGAVYLDDTEISLTSQQRAIFNRIARADGKPVSKAEFIKDAIVPNKNVLKVVVFNMREKFKKSADGLVKSTSPRKGDKKPNWIDGYYLNKALIATP